MSVNLRREFFSAESSVEVIGILPLDLLLQDLSELFTDLLLQKPDLSFEIVCESDNELFTRSLSLDTPFSKERRSFASMRLARKLLLNLHCTWQEEQKGSGAERFRVNLLHMPLTQYLIRIDSRKIFAAPVTHRLPNLADYELVTTDSVLHGWLADYLDFLFDERRGRRLMADSNTEILELYDQDRLPRGTFPRDSFYDTDYHQLVIWDFIFDRAGNLLIHRRGPNAKDNRDMWDKSVGGHVDWKSEFSTAKAAVRELVEELFEDELNKEAMAHFTESQRNTIYLGDWRTDKRGLYALHEIRTLGEAWAYFSLPEPRKIDSPRHLPDGTVRRLRVFAECFLFVANAKLSPENLETLQNSDFRLLPVAQLKTELESGVFTTQDGSVELFRGSPDLNTIMTSELREILDEFSQLVQVVFRAA